MHQTIAIDMVKATCRDYGHDCDYTVEGDIDKVAEEFGKHTADVHGIEYSKVTLTKFMLNK
jgi:predicted small metal-binding protein